MAAPHARTLLAWALVVGLAWACKTTRQGSEVLAGSGGTCGGGPTSSGARVSSGPQDCELWPAPGALAALLAYEDTDGDRRITVRDEGARWFALPLAGGGTYRVQGTARLAQLVQELFLAHEEDRTSIHTRHIEEATIDRLSRLIREKYWTALTRTIDSASLEAVLTDPKMDARRQVATGAAPNWPADCTPPPASGLSRFLYVPASDQAALGYYQQLTQQHPQLVVCQLPPVVTPEWVRGLSATRTRGSRHGLLSLALRSQGTGLQPVPYVVPGGRFNELYGWDSYFHVLGLLEDGRLQLARDVVDNLLYEVRHYGHVLNANRTYYLNRSQPPLLSSAVRAIWEASPAQDAKWLRAAVAAITAEYLGVWTAQPRTTLLCRPLRPRRAASPSSPSATAGSPSSLPPTASSSGTERLCLSTYHAQGIGEPPEVEDGHFAWLYQERARPLGLDADAYRNAYLGRSLPAAELDALDWFFVHDRSMRESGHDTTYRWTTDEGDRCADFATVDLNALLFKVELDLAHLKKELGEDDWSRWCDRATARRELMQQHLWNGHLFVDFHLRRDAGGHLSAKGEQSAVVSATTLYPLWASAPSPCTAEGGEPLHLVNGEQAGQLVEAALGLLETAGGLAGTGAPPPGSVPREPARQWDYPLGWAPHQILAWEGLRRFGFERPARRLAYRWLYTVTHNAHDYHGTVPEKFDVVRRSHEVFAEYGNVGVDFSYITREGFGWMNASVQLGKRQLPPALLERLRALDPPERIEGL